MYILTLFPLPPCSESLSTDGPVDRLASRVSFEPLSYALKLKMVVYSILVFSPKLLFAREICEICLLQAPPPWASCADLSLLSLPSPAIREMLEGALRRDPRGPQAGGAAPASSRPVGGGVLANPHSSVQISSV